MKQLTLQKISNGELAALRANEDWDALARAAEYWVKFALKGLRYNANDRDDVLQEARLAALEAMRRWEPEKAAFSTFLAPRIRGAVQDYLATANSGGIGSTWQHDARRGEDVEPAQFISLNDPATTEEGEEGGEPETHLDSLAYEEPPQGFDDPAVELEKEQAAEEAAAVLGAATAEDANLLRSLYFKDKSMSEVGVELGLDKSTVSRRAQAAQRQAKTRDIRSARPRNTRGTTVPGMDGREYRVTVNAPVGGPNRESRPTSGRPPIGFYRGLRGAVSGGKSHKDNLSNLYGNWAWSHETWLASKKWPVTIIEFSPEIAL